jgi:transcriptional regulator with XRE-family HTH domain
MGWKDYLAHCQCGDRQTAASLPLFYHEIVECMAEGASPFLDFANNLRRLTEKKGAIAQVCRDLGMNRQQFNKYLSGTTLPSPQTLRKLADYFGVNQRAMFSPVEAPHQLPGLEQLDSRIAKALLGILSGSTHTQFREGCYMIYYPWLGSPKEIMRAVMVVFKVGEQTLFRRYTRLAAGDRVRVSGSFSRHEGIIIENMGRVFLLAKNMRGAGELSLQSFGSSTTVSNEIISGLALIFTPWQEPTATRVTIDYHGTRGAFRNAIRLCGVVPGSTPSISDIIKRSVLESVSFPTPQLFPFQIFDKAHP